MGRVSAMKILLATDGSDSSALGTKLLLRLKPAATFDVHVLSVVNLAVVPGPLELDFGTDYLKQLNTQCQASVDNTIKSFTQAGVTATGEVVQGHPVAVIVDRAKELGVDLIVLGAQGHSLLARVLLGSVSDYVATHAPCSVLVVRDTPGLNSEAPLKIAAGFDDSAPSHNVLDELVRTGWNKGAKIDLINAAVLPMDNFSEIPVQFDPQEIIVAHEEALAKAVDAAQAKLGGAVTGNVEQCSNAGYGLVAFVEREKSDILMVGDTGRSFMARFFLGSVSRSVLHHSPSSVWIVRANVGK